MININPCLTQMKPKVKGSNENLQINHSDWLIHQKYVQQLICQVLRIVLVQYKVWLREQIDQYS